MGSTLPNLLPGLGEGEGGEKLREWEKEGRRKDDIPCL